MATPQRPKLSVAAAARATGAARTTIQRALKEGRLPNAVQNGNAWSIPVEDLLAAGFTLQHQGRSVNQERATAPAADAAPLKAPTDPNTTAELAELRKALAVEQARREAAEAVALERLRTIEAQAAHLRMLEAGPTSPTPQTGNGQNPNQLRTPVGDTSRGSQRLRTWLKNKL